jgi:hypothetical protein
LSNRIVRGRKHVAAAQREHFRSLDVEERFEPGDVKDRHVSRRLVHCRSCDRHEKIDPVAGERSVSCGRSTAQRHKGRAC